MKTETDYHYYMNESLPEYIYYFLIYSQEEPYLTLKHPLKGLKNGDNEQFEGWCKDLADLLAERMNIRYELRLVKDGKYGGKIPNSSEWNGMVGELVRQVKNKKSERICLFW